MYTYRGVLLPAALPMGEETSAVPYILLAAAAAAVVALVVISFVKKK